MKSAKKRYMKEIRKLFPMRGKREREYLDRLNQTIDHEIEDDATIFECRERFGQPNEVVAGYYETTDFDYIKKQIHHYKVLRNALVALVLIVTIGFALQQVIAYHDYVENFEPWCKGCYYEIEIGEVEDY